MQLKINSLEARDRVAVVWIRIDCMRIRIHKIWWMRIRIQVNKIPKLISKHLLTLKNFFSFLDAMSFLLNLILNF